MKSSEKMKSKNISVGDILWAKAKKKARNLPIAVSVSAVVRALLEKWISGEIELS